MKSVKNIVLSLVTFVQKDDAVELQFCVMSIMVLMLMDCILMMEIMPFLTWTQWMKTHGNTKIYRYMFDGKNKSVCVYEEKKQKGTQAGLQSI